MSKRKPIIKKSKVAEAATEYTTKQRNMMLLKEKYITSKVQGNICLSRMNMMINQLNGSFIFERVDDHVKSKELLYWEMIQQRRLAITYLRDAYFKAQELKKGYNLSDKEIGDIDDYYFKEPVNRDFSAENKVINIDFVN